MLTLTRKSSYNLTIKVSVGLGNISLTSIFLGVCLCARVIYRGNLIANCCSRETHEAVTILHADQNAWTTVISPCLRRLWKNCSFCGELNPICRDEWESTTLTTAPIPLTAVSFIDVCIFASIYLSIVAVENALSQATNWFRKPYKLLTNWG